METDLHVLNRAGILEDVHKQYIIYQVKYIFEFKYIKYIYRKFIHFYKYLK